MDTLTTSNLKTAFTDLLKQFNSLISTAPSKPSSQVEQLRAEMHELRKLVASKKVITELSAKQVLAMTQDSIIKFNNVPVSHGPYFYIFFVFFQSLSFLGAMAPSPLT